MTSIPAILELPPPEVAERWSQVLKPTFVIGGWLWILSYILLARENTRSKSYGMPLFALANNLAWEMVYAFYFHDVWFKRLVFVIWVFLEVPIVYGTMRNSKHEWSHTPVVRDHIGKILLTLTLWCALGHWSFLHWWFNWNISSKKGKFYRGVEGPDPTELKWWSGEFCQMTLSLTSLVQLITRQHTEGVTWAIW
ncbi:Putative terpene cyclase PaxB [Septoria linicola]|uniref:Terpene cyclase PaxB n=1 Tax=Septoria linicola TaxID=215465 RepID=A0A9Q9B2F5_9PEZI|nr:Putative terpene cyclase PaxB [Septoria linicola]